jgi:hypothetical protein
MTVFQCQHCGQPAEEGHNCDGTPFQSGPVQLSIAAIGSHRELLHKKGFHEESNIDGVFYRHPMHGIVAIYEGGTFRTAFSKTDLGVDAYLESLADSSYTDIGSQPYETGCDVCGGIGPLFPDEHAPFGHKENCPHRIK